MISTKIQELYHIGSLLYITTGVEFLAIDSTSKSLTEIPQCHLEQCFCQRLAKRLGISISYNHIYKQCDISTNINRQIIYECPFGLSNIIVPIFDNNQLIGALQAGPILTKTPENYMKDKIRPRWNLHPDDEKALIKELKEYPQGDNNYVIAISELISNLIENNPRLKDTAAPDNSEPDEHQSGSDRIASIVDFITSNYEKDITLTDVAKYAYVNPSHLSREFNKKMNMNFRSYLNSVRIEKAKELLVKTDLSLAEIGSMVGFADQSYFNKIFRKQEELTPGQYRTLHKLKK